MSDFILYGTAGCHLCELAEEVLVDAARSHVIEYVDIADSDASIGRYGVRIPVLRCVADGAELDWPFDVLQASAWVADHAAG